MTFNQAVILLITEFKLVLLFWMLTFSLVAVILYLRKVRWLSFFSTLILVSSFFFIFCGLVIAHYLKYLNGCPYILGECYIVGEYPNDLDIVFFLLLYLWIVVSVFVSLAAFIRAKLKEYLVSKRDGCG